MVQNIGLNLLVPLFVFGFLIVGALTIANMALKDVVARRKKGH
jgi:hypothetical protein